MVSSFIGSTKRITLYSIADSYVNASSPDTNYGNEQYLYVNASSTDFSQNMIYINFDLSSIPQNTHIVSASLDLRLSGFDNLYYGIMGGGDRIGAYYCSDNSWPELGITWNNRPEFDNMQTDNWGSGMFVYYTYKSWDVTEDVKKSLPLGALTEVLKFSSKNDGYGYARFQSKEDTNKPKLEIEYTTEPVFEVQFESAQDPVATNYFPSLDPNLGFISFADETFSIPETYDVTAGSYPVEYDSGYNFVRWETTGGITVSDSNAKSTTATISGSGILKAVGNAEKLEYYYDTGKPYQNCSLLAGQIYAKQFNPILSGQLLSVRYCLVNLSLTSKNSFRVHILNSEKEDLITPFEVTPTSEGWYDVNLITSDIDVIEKEDFYVAIEFVLNEIPCICGTGNYNYPCRDFSWNGTDWENNYDDLMIRATVLNNIYPEPEPTTPGPAEPTPIEPEPMEPIPSEPESTTPEPTILEPTEPESTIPEQAEPEPTKSEPTEPEPTAPESTTSESTEPRPTESEPTRYAYTSEQHNFSIEPPSGWNVDDTKTGAAVYFYGPTEEGFMVNINIQVESLATTMTLEQYVSAAKDTLQSSLDNYELISESPTIINKFNAYELVSTFTYANVDIKNKQVALVNANKAYIITYSALPTTYQKYLSSIESSIKTFKIIKPEPTTPQPTTSEPEEPLTAEESTLPFNLSMEMLLAIVAVISIIVVALVAYKLGKRNANRKKAS